MRIILATLFFLITFSCYAVDNLSIVCNGKSSTISTNSNEELKSIETKSYVIKNNKLEDGIVSCDCVETTKDKIVCNGKLKIFLRIVEIDRVAATVKEVNISQFPKFTSTEEFKGVCSLAKRKF